MHKKGISVVLTTYNGAQFIQKQIASILNQTVLPQEIIICDDRSTDNTADILKSFATNNLIKLFINEKQLGVVDNFKKGVRNAIPGNWIAFADQDDIWSANKLERLGNAMQDLDDDFTPALIFSDLNIINQNDDIINNSFWNQQKINPAKISLKSLLYGNMLINAPMLTEFLNMPKLEFLHDEWLALIAYSFGKFKFIPEQLIQYRQHNNNVTFSNNIKPLNFCQRLKVELNHISGKKKFLPRQFQLAKSFLKNYRNQLDGNSISILEGFIKLENKHYLFQRLSRKIANS
jgi:glycosyltransferase involved in cell wall biosynthesis